MAWALRVGGLLIEAASGPVSDSFNENVGEGWLGEGHAGGGDGDERDVGGFGNGVELHAGLGAVAAGDL